MEISKKRFILFIAISVITSVIINVLIIIAAWFYLTGGFSSPQAPSEKEQKIYADLSEKIVPSEGAILPVKFNDIGVKLVETGVIDIKKFESLYENRGGLDQQAKDILYKGSGENIKITNENSGILLNILWALGLGNKNDILENGPMVDKRYGGAGNFASTGGWTLAKGNAMDHYSKHQFINLTPAQQTLVEKVSKNIYRPCCDNSTFFPDCNHGMAMLGLLQLMALQGATEENMYKTALIINSYWFPDTYLTIAYYMNKKGLTYEKQEAQKILGANFSSASGYGKILNEVAPPTRQGGGGCGV